MSCLPARCRSCGTPCQALWPQMESEMKNLSEEEHQGLARRTLERRLKPWVSFSLSSWEPQVTLDLTVVGSLLSSALPTGVLEEGDRVILHHPTSTLLPQACLLLALSANAWSDLVFLGLSSLYEANTFQPRPPGLSSQLLQVQPVTETT